MKRKWYEKEDFQKKGHIRIRLSGKQSGLEEKNQPLMVVALRNGGISKVIDFKRGGFTASDKGEIS
jgi:hypothetical protein